MSESPPEAEVQALAARVGEGIHQARKMKGWTLQHLAGASGISQPFLSQLENGHSMPSLITLHRVARVLGTTVQDLVTEDRDSLNVSVVRASEGRTFQLADGAKVRFLTQGTHIMEPNEVTADPGTSAGAHTKHAGEEIIYVIDGSIRVQFSTGRHELLDAGDTICYRADAPHEWFTTGDTAARFLIVSSPPSF